MHSPVYNKDREAVTSAVTNLDIHDISRLSKTYGLQGYYIVTPLSMQQKLVGRLLEHWMSGRGASWNQTRHDAFQLVHLVPDLDEVKQAIRERTGKEPKVVATTARTELSTTGFKALRKQMQAQQGPWLIMFGTGWGLVDEFLHEQSDYILEPIDGMDESREFGPQGYNHLSVRCAVAIIVDRLLGPLGLADD